MAYETEERTNPFHDQLTHPAGAGFAITPNDSVDLARTTRAIWVGTGGTLRVILPSGDDITLLNVADGSLLPIQARRVYNTTTTASNLVGLY